MKVKSFHLLFLTFILFALSSNAGSDVAIAPVNSIKVLVKENKVNKSNKKKKHINAKFNKQPPCCQTATYFGQCGYDSNGNPTFAYGTGMVCIEPADATPEAGANACTVAYILAENQANANYNNNCNQS